MDKRIFSAFLVSIVVALLYQHFVMRPMYEEQKKEQQQAAEQQSVASNDGQVVPAQQQTPSTVQPAAPQPAQTAQAVLGKDGYTWPEYAQEQEIVLENDEVYAVFTNIGACLKSMTLKQSKRGDVSLVTAQNYRVQPYYIDLGDASVSQNVPVYTTRQIAGNVIEFTRETDAYREEKVVTLQAGSYQIDVEYTITARDETVFLADGIGFTLGSINKVNDDDKREDLVASAYLDEKKGELKTQKLKGEKSVTHITGDILWGSIKNKYYTLISKPDRKFTTLSVKMLNPTGQENVSYLRSGQVQVGAGKSVTFNFLTYAGPQLLKNLVPFKSDFEKTMYFTGFFGPINLFLIKSLNMLYAFTRNYGIAIILLTIIIKLIFYPLTRKSFKSMKKMQELQPKMNIIKEKYKDDQNKMQQEIMALYKREKVNPLGGCLPMLIQLPIFFGLYRTLYNAYELIDAKFLWISSLSEPDQLFTIAWGGSSFPLNILPLIMGVTMFVQQKMSSADPQQQKMMMFMPIIFTFILYNLPSGLVLYWTLSNVLSIVQQHYVKTT